MHTAGLNRCMSSATLVQATGYTSSYFIGSQTIINQSCASLFAPNEINVCGRDCSASGIHTCCLLKSNDNEEVYHSQLSGGDSAKKKKTAGEEDCSDDSAEPTDVAGRGPVELSSTDSCRPGT